MPHKIGFVVVSSSGHEDGFSARELMIHAPTVSGWRSPRWVRRWGGWGARALGPQGRMGSLRSTASLTTTQTAEPHEGRVVLQTHPSSSALDFFPSVFKENLLNLFPYNVNPHSLKKHANMEERKENCPSPSSLIEGQSRILCAWW